jgi:FKBP-type peptidyl-prolyl cis-trans isomerase FkpA
MLKPISILLLLLGVVGLQGCSKDAVNPDEAKYAENQQEIQQYIAQNKLQMQSTTSGLYYQIIRPSTSSKTTQRGSQVVMSFVGKLTNGSIFDSAKVDENRFIRFPWGVSATLPGLDQIAGLLKEGDSARVIMPSNLGFGSQAYTKIPAYSVLVFDLSLEKIQTEDEALQAYARRKKYEATKTASGLYYTITRKDSTGTPIADKSKVTIIYKGMFLDGSIFDQTPAGQTSQFDVKGVIPGFTEGLKLMRTKEKAVFMIPSKIAYGERGESRIPPFSPLVFEVEVISAQ